METQMPNKDPEIFASIPKHVKTITSNAEWGTIQHDMWRHVLTEFLELDDDDAIAKSLANNGITSFNYLLNLSLEAIDALIYIDDEPFPVGILGRLNVLISLFNDWSYNYEAHIDLRTVTEDDMYAYVLSFYDTTKPLGVFQQQQRQYLPVPANTPKPTIVHPINKVANTATPVQPSKHLPLQVPTVHDKGCPLHTTNSNDSKVQSDHALSKPTFDDYPPSPTVITPTVITPNATPQPNSDHKTSYLDHTLPAYNSTLPTQSNNDNELSSIVNLEFYSTADHDDSSIDEWGVNNDSSLEEHRQVYSTAVNRQVYSTVNHDDSSIDEWGVKTGSSIEEYRQVNQSPYNTSPSNHNKQVQHDEAKNAKAPSTMSTLLALIDSQLELEQTCNKHDQIHTPKHNDTPHHIAKPMPSDVLASKAANRLVNLMSTTMTKTAPLPATLSQETQSIQSTYTNNANPQFTIAMPTSIFTLAPQTSNTNDNAHPNESKTTNPDGIHQHETLLSLKDDGRHREEEGFHPKVTTATFISDDLDTSTMTTHFVNTHNLDAYIDSNKTSHVTFIFKDPSAPSISRYELNAASTNNMAILGLTFDDDNPATTAYKFDDQHANTTTVYVPSLPQNGEFSILTIITERSDHGEHITSVCETPAVSITMHVLLGSVRHSGWWSGLVVSYTQGDQEVDCRHCFPGQWQTA